MIMILDGDAATGSSIERALRYRGLEAMAIQNGMEALALLDIRIPKAIVLDLAIDGMDGMLFLRAVRASPVFAAVPIIVYTANFADDVRRAAIQAGAQDFIVKGTVGWESLVERIRKLTELPPKPPF